LSVTDVVYDIPWSTFYIRGIAVFKVLLGDVFQVAALDCVQRVNFFDSLLLSTLLPLGFVLALLGLAVCASERAFVCAKWSCCLDADSRRMVRNLSIKAATIVMTLCYPAMSLKALQIFSCQTVDGVSYLRVSA